jgi:hypothetical protein
MARMENDYELFDKVLHKIEDGMSITFTKDNIADGDNFLILDCGYDSCTITFKRFGDMWYVLFDNDEPILLEDVPVSFLRSILKNIK